MSSDQNWSGVPYGTPFSGVASTGETKFGTPWLDVASQAAPTDLQSVMEWAEHVFLTYGTYPSVAQKVVRYFLTDLILEGGDEEERKEFNDLLLKKMRFLSILAELGDDRMVYGNSFSSLIFPFSRFLNCPQCGTNYKAEVLNYKFINKGGPSIEATCPKCRYHGTFLHEDRRSPDKTQVCIKRWNPKFMRLKVHPFTNKVDYYYEIPGTDFRMIQDGHPFYINNTPWPMIEAACDKDHLFHFEQGQLFHMRASCPAGVPIWGWGIPPVVTHFKLIYYIQLLRKYDEAIALDFIIPLRTICPPAAQGGVDPLKTYGMSSFVAKIQGAIYNKRRDPTSVAILPFPIQYQMLGGEGKTLAPKDSLALAIDELLNAQGYPAELYKGTLSLQAFPVALRLFERTWGDYVDDLNRLVDWVVTSMARTFMLGDITGKLRSVTLADDIERKTMTLQAAAGMDISKGTAYLPYGLNYIEEQKRIVEEQKAIQELQQEAMEDQQASQMGDTMGQGQPGQPGQAGGQVGATPGDVYEQAKQLAQQLLYSTPETMRRGELIKIKQSNPTLHALVLQEMDQLRQEMGRQGGAMMMEQQKQQTMGGMVAQASAGDILIQQAKNLPGLVGLKVEMARELCDYTRADMRKLAMAVKREEQGALAAFRFVFRKSRGWE